jgi:hypothetical protein
MSRQPRLRYRASVEMGDGLSGSSGGVRRSALKDPYKLERRRQERHGAEGMLTASYSDGANRFGITHLELVDRSPGGLAARTRVRIEPGEMVTICPEGSTIPWVSARAVRCVENGGVFVVGMRYCGGATAA